VQVRRYGDNLSGDPDLRSPAVLRKRHAVLRFRKLKLAHCRSPEELAFVRREIATAAYILGQCSGEQADTAGARQAYLESLRSRLSFRTLKALAGVLLPAPIRASLRRRA